MWLRQESVVPARGWFDTTYNRELWHPLSPVLDQFQSSVLCFGPQGLFPKHSSHLSPPTQTPYVTHQPMGCWQLPLASTSPGLPCLRNPPFLQSSSGARELLLPLLSLSKSNQEGKIFSWMCEEANIKIGRTAAEILSPRGEGLFRRG